MKLQHLTESTSIDSKHLEKFRDEVIAEIHVFEKFLTSHGFKLNEITSDPDDETYFGVSFTSKFFEVLFEILLNNGELFDLGYEFYIVDDMTIGSGQTFASNIITKTWEGLDSKILADKIKTCIHELEPKITTIIDWYFDLSAEYGKVKMLVSAAPGNGKTIRAVAGDFDIQKNSGKVY